MSCGDSPCSRTTLVRDSRAAFTSNDGFSVVAPISMTVPASTCGSNASCCALLKRWISSTNSTVRSPCWSRRVAASAMASRRSLTPAMTAETATKRACASAASRRASVVLPVPGGPHRMMRRQVPRIQGPPQQLARAQQVRLPDHLGQRARAHPLGQRLPAPILRRRPRKQVHGAEFSQKLRDALLPETRRCQSTQSPSGGVPGR